MNVDEFNQKTGRVVQVGSYFTFEPNPLPLKIEYTPKIIQLLSDSLLKVGTLNGTGSKMSNPHLLILPYLKKEAVLSSKIEGTRTTLSEVFKSEKVKEKENDDLEEVKNYIKALEFGLEEIKTKNIDQNLILNLHKILMQGVRGRDKEPGQFRNVQNWIGNSYDIHEAKFVPPSPESIPFLLKNLETYIFENNEVNDLIKVAIIHYQFETIHPFRDGNGRLGRLLIILYLCKKRILSLPLLYLSAFFEKYRDEYIEKLFNVSAKGEINNWIEFFLKGVSVQTEDTLNRVKALEDYKLELYKLAQEKTTNNNILLAIDNLFINPYTTLNDVRLNLKFKNLSSAKNIIDTLQELNVIEEITGKERNKLYLATKIKEILEK